jgi:hypothetical protein
VNKPNVDQLGSVASFACAIHCAVSGVALGVLSSVGLGFIGHPVLEVLFIGSTVSLGIWAVVRGFRIHHSWNPLLLFLAGLSMIVLAHLNEPGWMFSVIGGAVLIAFHWTNQRLTSRCAA